MYTVSKQTALLLDAYRIIGGEFYEKVSDACELVYGAQGGEEMYDEYVRQSYEKVIDGIFALIRATIEDNLGTRASDENAIRQI